MDRYGNRISVNGSPEFKARVIKAAVDGNLSIKFADQGLERRRQALMARIKGPSGLISLACYRLAKCTFTPWLVAESISVRGFSYSVSPCN